LHAYLSVADGDIASGGFVSGGSAVIGDGTVAIHASGQYRNIVPTTGPR
jgi:hypothetical protein